MKVIPEKNYKNICEAYKQDYRVFKLYNADFDTVRKVIEAIEIEYMEETKKYHETRHLATDSSYEYSLEAEITIFDVTVFDKGVQFCLSGGDYPYPELIFYITKKTRDCLGYDCFGYGESIVKQDKKFCCNPDIIYSLNGNEITGEEFYVLAHKKPNKKDNHLPNT